MLFELLQLDPNIYESKKTVSIPQVKLKIEEIHQSAWLQDLHAKPKLRT